MMTKNRIRGENRWFLETRRFQKPGKYKTVYIKENFLYVYRPKSDPKTAGGSVVADSRNRFLISMRLLSLFLQSLNYFRKKNTGIIGSNNIALLYGALEFSQTIISQFVLIL